MAVAVQCVCNSARAHTHTQSVTCCRKHYMPYNEAFPNSSISTASSVESNQHTKHSITLTQVRTNFPRIQQPSQNSGRQKGDIKQVSYRGPKCVSHQRSQFSRQHSCTSALRSLRPVLTQTECGASSTSSHRRL
jgi:hypothetical protein